MWKVKKKHKNHSILLSIDSFGHRYLRTVTTYFINERTIDHQKSKFNSASFGTKNIVVEWPQSVQNTFYCGNFWLINFDLFFRNKFVVSKHFIFYTKQHTIPNSPTIFEKLGAQIINNQKFRNIIFKKWGMKVYLRRFVSWVFGAKLVNFDGKNLKFWGN